MPTFRFSARDAAGGMLRGVQPGASAAALADELMRAGHTPLSITPIAVRAALRLPWATSAAAPAAAAAPVVGAKGKAAGKVRHEELLMFTRQLHTLLKSGIAITRALNALAESATASLGGVIRQMRDSLETGHEVSVSMANHPAVFSRFYVAMVRVGEMTGRLDDIFMRLFHHLEFEKLMREQVKAALRYPAFVISVMLAALIVINVFVIPAFQKVFEGFGAQLPLMTRILIGFSQFTLAFGPYIVVALVATAFAVRHWVRTPRGEYTWDRLSLRLPLAGKIMRKATMARFSRSFALALKSGVPVVQAIQVVSGTVDNAYIARALDKMRDGVERGDSVLNTATASGIFMPVVLQMMAVGEESGALDEMLDEVAGFYQQEVEYELKALSSQIEPILIMFLGVLVLILALGVFLPIWDLSRAAMH